MSDIALIECSVEKTNVWLSGPPGGAEDGAGRMMRLLHRS